MGESAIEKIVPSAYGVNDAAAYLSVSPRTIWDMVRRGEIDSLLIGTRRLIPRDELDRIIAERRSRKRPNGNENAA